jgi:hypothetical protein
MKVIVHPLWDQRGNFVALIIQIMSTFTVGTRPTLTSQKTFDKNALHDRRTASETGSNNSLQEHRI